MALGGGQIVISSSELDRIQQALLPENERPGAGKNSAKQSRERSAELHAQSQARAKLWSNTLEGSRRKKAEDKQKKLELEELERQRVDAEEAKIQLDQRKATIDRANKLLYDESDRMKSFHSKMMLCDVLAEREAQVSLKDELKKLEHVREDRFLEMQKQNYRKMLEREIKEKETKEELSRVAAKAQKEQLAEYKDKRFREVEDQMLEGELLRRKAIEDLEAERKAEQKRCSTAVQASAATQQANEYLKQIKAEDLLRQQREEEHIEAFSKRKEKLLELRKKKEEEVFQSKQDARNQMIEAQARNLQDMSQYEHARVERQAAEKDADDERKRVAKEAQKQRWEQDIQKSRAAQIARKRSDRERGKAEDAETAKFLSEWCKVLDEQEQKEQETKNAANRKLAAEHKKMVEIQRSRGSEEKTQEAAVAMRAKKAMEADTVEFHGYAENCIREYADSGKNVAPLIKELREFRKRVLD